MDIKSIIQKSKELKDPALALLNAINEIKAKISEELKVAVENLEEKLELEVKQAVQEYGKELKDSHKEVDLYAILKDVKGKQGEQGEKGEKGDRGEPGQSIKGDKGDRGEKGERGAPGRDGYGRDGQNGKDGQPGKDGSPDTPDQIANKLNTLEDKVEMKVIRGLGQKLKVMEQNIQEKKRSSGGGGMGNWVHQSFSVNSSTTSITLSTNIAAGGFALIAFYQGQNIFRGTHYTQSGKVLTLLFTPEDNTAIDVTYVRT